LLIVVPSPSCPAVLLPQQYQAPVAVPPQLWFAPASTWVKTTPGGAFTGTGIRRRFEMLPSPSCPAQL